MKGPWRQPVRDRRPSPLRRVSQPARTPFDRVQSLADLGQDEFIRGGLIDIGHIPVEDGSKFVDEASHIADELAALALRLDRRTRK